MKRFVILSAMLALMFSGSMAGNVYSSENMVNNLAPEQEKKLTLKTGHPDVEVQIKRCIAQGEDVIIDLMVTSHTKWEKIYFIPDAPQCFDDEGNYYKTERTSGGGLAGSIQYEIDGENKYWRSYLITEEDIPRKIRIIIKNVDEYASTFLSMKFPYLGNGDDELKYTLSIKNLPITRE